MPLIGAGQTTGSTGGFDSLTVNRKNMDTRAAVWHKAAAFLRAKIGFRRI